MEGRAGQQFGNYRLIRLLGRGGFAEVYLGEHIYLGTQAAVKVLQTQLAKDQTEQFRTEDGTAQVWNANTGANLVTYRGHNATIRSVTWSPDGQRIATASEDQTVQVWNSSTGANILTYRGHSNLLRTVEWSHDGTRIVSGGKDSTAQIWDAQSGNTIFTYRSHSATVFDAQWSLDDTRIASCSTDTTVQVWQAI